MTVYDIDPSFPIEEYITLSYCFAGEDPSQYSERMRANVQSNWTVVSWERSPKREGFFSARIEGGQKGYYIIQCSVKSELYSLLFPDLDLSAYEVGDKYGLYPPESWYVWDIHYELYVDQTQMPPIGFRGNVVCRA